MSADRERPGRRVAGHHGELVLRSRDGHHEIISNGVLLMDTRGGGSERLLVRHLLRVAPGAQRVLIGGLGVGFSLAEAISAAVPQVTVVECEPAVIEWNRDLLGDATGGSVMHPSVTCITADIVTWLEHTEERFDAICLDVDNGPGWTVGAGNDALYSATGLRGLARRLEPGGALGIWSAHRSPAFERRLRAVFGGFHSVFVPAGRGGPDVLYVTGIRSGQQGIGR